MIELGSENNTCTLSFSAGVFRIVKNWNTVQSHSKNNENGVYNAYNDLVNRILVWSELKNNFANYCANWTVFQNLRLISTREFHIL